MQFFRSWLLICFACALPAQNLINSAFIESLQMSGGSSPVFVAGTSAGLYVSRDERQSWQPVALTSDFTRQQPGVSQIERDPANGDAFYAAGSADRFSASSTTRGVRIYRSDDRGQTWALKVSGLPADGELQQIFVMLNSPGVLYAHVQVGDEARVYKSTNRAESWGQPTALPAGSNRLLINLRNPNLWYYETGRAIFRSVNEGSSWSSAGAFPIRPSGSAGIQNSLTAWVTDPNNQNILAITTNGPVFGSEEYNNGAFFSDNQGASWQRKTNSGAQQMFLDGVLLIHQAESSSLWVSNDSGRTLRAPVRLREGSGRAQGFLVDRRDGNAIYSGMRRSVDQGRTWTSFDGAVRPFIGVESGPVELSGSSRDVAPRLQQLSVVALGGAGWDLPFTIESSAGWLTVSPAQGITSAVVGVRAAAGGLAIGVHEATLTIRSPEAFNEAVQVPVRLTVTDASPAEPTPTILTFAGDGSFASTGDGGPAREASLEGPRALAFDADGGLLIADSFADRVRHVNAAGVISTFAGTGAGGFAGDGGPAARAQIDSPRGVSVGRLGEVYIADGFNRRVRVVNPAGVISTFAGNGELGSSPAQGRLEDLRVSPTAVLSTPDGGLYLSGSGTYRINADGSYVRWSSTSYDDLALSPDGRLYGVSSNRVLELRPNNFTLPYAGTTQSGYAGDGGPATEARLNGPSGIAFDADGRLFIADTNNHVIRVVGRDRNIATYAGTGVQGAEGDGGPANHAQLSSPSAVEVGPDGRLYIAGGRKVRVVLPPGSAAPAPALSSAGVVSAASYTGGAVAPNQIISIFGANLGSEVAAASQTPLPETLAGVRVDLIDAGGVARRLKLFFVAPHQINALVSEATATGTARLRVTAPDGQTGEATIEVARVAPGLFSANANGQGVAAAAAIRVAANGAQSPINILTGSGPVTGAPIQLGPAGDQVVLLLFGTGFRAYTSSVNVTIGGVPATVLGVAAQPEFVGLDQMNVLIPRELAGRGEVEVRVAVDGKPANVVTVLIQ